jgi:hypothetical protein
LGQAPCSHHFKAPTPSLRIRAVVHLDENLR